MPTAKICKFRPRTELRDLCAPSREDDEKLLRVIAAYEADGGTVTFDEPRPFVSEYLTRPLRTEEQARAELNRPRIAPTKGLLQLIAEQAGIDRAFAKIVGGQ